MEFLNFQIYFLIGLMVFFLLNIIRNLGKKFVFLDLISFIALAQWNLGVIIFREIGLNLKVSYVDYFSLSFWGSLLFVFGLNIPRLLTKSRSYKEELYLLNFDDFFKRNSNGYKILFIGIIATLIKPYLPGGISYIFSILENLLLIGMLYVFFGRKPGYKVVLVFCFLLVFYKSVGVGMIKLFFFWIVVVGDYIVFGRQLKYTFLTKIVGVVFLLWVLIILQSSKIEYRGETWAFKEGVSGQVTERIVENNPRLFLSLIQERVFNPGILFEPEALLGYAGRINQGYLISQTMYYVPRYRNHEFGNLNLNGALISFIPRIIWPSKPKMFTKDYYQKYSGIKLQKYHAASFGTLGDAYIDFGRFAPVFMLFFGVVIGFVFHFFYWRKFYDPTYLLWFSGIFILSLSQAEVNFVGYINGLFKGFILIVFLKRVLD